MLFDPWLQITVINPPSPSHQEWTWLKICSKNGEGDEDFFHEEGILSVKFNIGHRWRWQEKWSSIFKMITVTKSRKREQIIITLTVTAGRCIYYRHRIFLKIFKSHIRWAYFISGDFLHYSCFEKSLTCRSDTSANPSSKFSKIKANCVVFGPLNSSELEFGKGAFLKKTRVS